MRIFALLISVAVIVGCDRTYTDTMPPPDPADPGMEQSPEVRTYTLKDYESISTGMTRAEVEELLGPGESASRADIAGIQTEVMIWKNPDFSNLVVTFQNDAVTSTSQSNLK